MSKGIEQDVAFIQALAQLIRDSDLTEIEVEREYGEDDELKVRLSRAVAAPAAPVYVTGHSGGHQMHGSQMHGGQNYGHQAPGAQAPQPHAAAEADGPDMTNAVTSPMVGTVYLSPEPGAEPFVGIGDEVTEGQTILIIEAMKTMNQIPAPRAGRVRAVLVENAEPVEFGEPMMIIE